MLRNKRFQTTKINDFINCMNKLNLSVYSSLKDYKETYEFYKTRQEMPEIIRLKVIQGLWNKDVEDESIAA